VKGAVADPDGTGQIQRSHVCTLPSVLYTEINATPTSEHSSRGIAYDTTPASLKQCEVNGPTHAG
jgi:hypothetical protein